MPGLTSRRRRSGLERSDRRILGERNLVKPDIAISAIAENSALVDIEPGGRGGSGDLGIEESCWFFRMPAFRRPNLGSRRLPCPACSS